jgi:cation diffusion facilitator CzcD-associated flavoprotein CzcO
LEKYVKFNSKVKSATWDEDAGVWRLAVIAEDGTQFEDKCEILVNGSGVLK